MLSARKVTLQAIAEAANVSVSTVSRALRDDPMISRDRIERVRRIASELNYRPKRGERRSPAGLPLRGKQVAIISLGMDRSLLSLPVIASAINGVEAGLSAAGASPRLIHLPIPDAAPASLAATPFDGLVLLGAMQGRHVCDRASSLLAQFARRPLVWVLGRPDGCVGDVSSADDFALGGMAAEHLVSRGHRQLAIVNPKPDHLLFVHREDGFLARSRRLGVDVRVFAESPEGGWSLPLHPPEAIGVVQGLVDRLLAAEPRPTAVFAVADSVATLVYGALARRGVRVGEDLSVISGNNDRALIQGLHPALTTLDIHAAEIGRVAADCLVRRLLDGDHHPQLHLETHIGPTLVAGESVLDRNR